MSWHTSLRGVGWEIVRLLRAANVNADADAKADLVRLLHATPDVTPLQEDIDDVEDSVDTDAPLTKQELEWIVATRDAAAVQSLPCTNVELVQLAIVTKGDTAKALSRLKKMAAWRKDHSLDDISFADAFRKVGARRLTLTLTLTLTRALTMQFNTTVMMSGYGCLAPYGRAQSGSTALCVWYSVRPVQTLTALRVAALCMPL